MYLLIASRISDNMLSKQSIKSGSHLNKIIQQTDKSFKSWDKVIQRVHISSFCLSYLLNLSRNCSAVSLLYLYEQLSWHNAYEAELHSFGKESRNNCIC